MNLLMGGRAIQGIMAIQTAKFKLTDLQAPQPRKRYPIHSLFNAE